MDDLPKQEVEHLKVAETLPAVPTAIPAAEVLKQILEQMIENERRRARNEYIRIGSLFLALLLLVMAAGFWIAHDLLKQAQEARLTSSRAQAALMSFLAGTGQDAAALEALMPAREQPTDEIDIPARPLQKSLSIPVAADLPLRLPIPAP